MTNRSSATPTNVTTVTAATTTSSTPVLGVGGGRDHGRDDETSCRDTKADCKHG